MNASPAEAPEWLDRASCARLPLTEVDRIFWSDSSLEDAYSEAKTVCSECPVRASCEANSQQLGVWGGTTAQERGESSKTIRFYPESHGTYARWTRGCRCEECCDAKRAYNRQQMRAWRSNAQKRQTVVLPARRQGTL